MTKHELPQDVDQCHDIILEMHARMQRMEQQMQALLRDKYGRKSETLDPAQLRLFAGAAAQEAPAAAVVEEQPQPKTGHGRRKPAKELPRIQQKYFVPESELPCPGCAKPREIFGEEVSEQYDYVPSSVRVIEHVRYKYCCKACSGHIIVAPKPNTLFDKCLASEAMIAEIATRKFGDHMPLNRLEGVFKRDGAPIPRSTMCDWLIAMSERLLPLYGQMTKRVLASSIIWTDDTPVKMQDREHERNMRNARVWVYLGDKRNPFTIFDFTESRKRDGPLNFLKNFSGFLQADAFAGYDCIYAGGAVTEVACMAHVRRKFFDALPTNEKACSQALAFIQQLYAVEKEAPDLDVTERASLRREKSLPTLLEFKRWLDQQKLAALPKSPLGKAVTYALNNWSSLCTYVENGELSIDNNKSERALRGMAVGRKNWLFMGSKTGGNAATILASFVATCKQHNVHPRIYFEDVLKRLANGETNFDELLPDRWQLKRT